MKQKKSNPEISVVMSAYNSEKYIAEAISSILNQTFKNFELIIINDKSKDSTVEIIKEYAKKDGRIVLIDSKNNHGAAGARNLGLKIAKGKYIAIMDSDDLSSSERLDIQWRYLEDNPQIFLVGGSYVYINSNGKKIQEVISNLNSEDVKKVLPKKIVIHNPTVMFRNEGYNYRDKFIQAEDYDLWLRLLTKMKKMVVIEDVVLKYRLHENSYSTKANNQQTRFVDLARKFYEQREKSGFDGYSGFSDNFSSSRDKILGGPEIVQIKNIKFAFRASKLTTFRKKLLELYKRRGIFIWWKGWIYYLISFMPKFIVDLFRHFIWRELDYKPQAKIMNFYLTS